MYPHVKDGSMKELLRFIGSTAKFVELNSDGVGYIYILTEVDLEQQDILLELAQNLSKEFIIIGASSFHRITVQELLSTDWTLEFDRFGAPYGSSKELLVTVGRKS